MSHEEEHGPAWMNEGNDEDHSLLFGSGNPSLQDEESGVSKQDSEYGSTSARKDDAESAKTSISNMTGKEPSEGSVIEGPRRNCLLHCFYFIEGFAIFSSFVLMATQLIPMLFLPTEALNPGAIVLKFYVAIFCVVFVLVEYNAPIGFLKDSMILQNYLSRGFIYTFLGVSALEEAYSERVQDTVEHASDSFHVAWIGVFMQVSAWMIFGVGVVYMVLGLCCLKRLRDKLRDDDRKKWKEYREAKRVLKKYQK